MRIEDFGQSRIKRSTYTVVIFFLYTVLWLGLCMYISGFSSDRDPYSTSIVTGVLIAAVLLHFVATSAQTIADVLLLLVAMTALIAPTAALVIHHTASPQIYLAYIIANATIAAFVVDVYTERSSAMPRWLAGLQVAYLVILGLDSLYRIFKGANPVADLGFFAIVHSIADVRLALFVPIAIAWLIIAILRCRRDGSIDDVPVVWRTDVSVLLAIIQVPSRFAVAVVTFLEVVLRRIGRDFLYEFRFHAQHLAKYLATIGAVAAAFIGSQEFSPPLVNYIRTSRPLELILQSPDWVMATPLIGFFAFLLAPFITASMTNLWLSRLSFQRLLQRSYQLAVIAAVPCTLIGLLFLAGVHLFDLKLKGFEHLSLVSSVVLAAVVIALLFSTKWRSLSNLPKPDEVEETPLTEAGGVNWRHGIPMLVVGGVVVLALGAFHAQQMFFTEPDMNLAIGQALRKQVVARNHWRYYWIDLPPGIDHLVITADAKEGVDLYSSFAKKPTTNLHDCRGGANAKGTIKTCDHSNPNVGRWWFGVRGPSGSTFTIDASTTFSIKGNTGHENTEVAASIAGSASPFKVTSDAQGNFSFTNIPGATYVLKPSRPFCRFIPPLVTVKVGPSSIKNDFSAKCSRVDKLEPGRPFSDRVSNGEWNYYLVHVPQGTKRLDVRIDKPGHYKSDGRKLYTKSGALPTERVSDCSASLNSGIPCRHQNPVAGDWWIGVYGGSYGYSYGYSYESASYAVRADLFN